MSQTHTHIKQTFAHTCKETIHVHPRVHRTPTNIHLKTLEFIIVSFIHSRHQHALLSGRYRPYHHHSQHYYRQNLHYYCHHHHHHQQHGKQLIVIIIPSVLMFIIKIIDQICVNFAQNKKKCEILQSTKRKTWGGVL